MFKMSELALIALLKISIPHKLTMDNPLGQPGLTDDEVAEVDGLINVGLVAAGGWHITDRGQAYVNAILATPLPEKRLVPKMVEDWVVPPIPGINQFQIGAPVPRNPHHPFKLYGDIGQLGGAVAFVGAADLQNGAG